ARSPLQVASREPGPAVIREICPATVVISGPAEILVADPRPTVVGVRPVAVCVGAPVWIAYCDVRLPAISVAFNFNPVSTGEIIVKEINRYVRPCLRKRRYSKREHT